MSKVFIAEEEDGSQWVSLDEYEKMKRSATDYAVVVEQFQKSLGVFTNSSAFAKIAELLADQKIGWISVEDRLPEKCVLVLVHIQNDLAEHVYKIAWLDAGLWWLSPTTALDRASERVTLWQRIQGEHKQV